MTVEPGALATIKASAARLAAAKSLSFTAVVDYEYPSKLGPPLSYTIRYDVVARRPDKIKVVVPGDGPPSEFVYDGKAMMAYDPTRDLAAVAEASGSIESALKQAFTSADIYFPFSDLLADDPAEALSGGALLAYTMGSSIVVGNVPTDMVVWANADVLLQLWIGKDDKLPRRIRAIYSADPLHLRHDMTLINWQIDNPATANAFVTSKTKSTGTMAFAKPSLPPKPKAQ
jgi:hypothetical protein